MHEAACKLERAATKRKTMKTPAFIEDKKFKVDDKIDAGHLLEEENWKIKNEKHSTIRN